MEIGACRVGSRGIRRGLTLLGALAAAWIAPCLGAHAYTYKVLYSFCKLSKCADGAGPGGNLLSDSGGDL